MEMASCRRHPPGIIAVGKRRRMTSESGILELPPEVTAELGWEPFVPLALEGGQRSFVSGKTQSGLLRVQYFRRRGDGAVVGRAWFGPGAAGPPGHAHGGSIAAVLDEAMGVAAWSSGYASVAAHLEVDFSRMIPLGTDALLEAWVEKASGRKVTTRGRLLDDDGEPFAEAAGLFVVLDPARFEDVLEKVAEAMGVDPADLLSNVETAHE